MLADHPQLVPVIAAWDWTEWGAAYPGSSAEAWAQNLAARAERGPVPFTLVAFAGQQPVGAVSFADHDMPDDPKVALLSPCVSGTYVLPSWRGQGVGTVLMEALEARARSFGLAKVFLFTAEAEAFYERLGWYTIHRTSDRGSPAAVMEKRLAAS